MLLAGGFVMEAKVFDDRGFALSLSKGATVLVEYRSAGGYAFKSVEQLRYDFERDVEDALRQA